MAVLTHTAQQTGTSTVSSTTCSITQIASTMLAGDTAFCVCAANSTTATGTLSALPNGNTWTLDSSVASGTGKVFVFRSNITSTITGPQAWNTTLTLSVAATRKAMTMFSVRGWTITAAVERSSTKTGTGASVSTGAQAATLSADEFVLAAYGANVGSGAPVYASSSGFAAGTGVLAATAAAGRFAAYGWKETSVTGAQADAATITGGSVPTDWQSLLLTYPAASGTLFTKSVSGAVSFTGIRPIVAMQRKQPAVLSFAGAEVAHPTGRQVTASFVPVGGLSRQLSLLRALTGALAFSGSASPAAARVRSLVGASLAPTGALSSIKSLSKSVSGALSFVGSQTHQARKALAGGLAPVGVLARQLALHATLTATLAMTTALNRFVNLGRAFSAALRPTGVIVTSSGANHFAAVFRPTAAAVTHGLPARTLFAGLALTGSVARFTARGLFSSLVASGVIHTQYLPPAAPPFPGGGGFGALMSDSFFQRYQVDAKWRAVKRVKA